MSTWNVMKISFRTVAAAGAVVDGGCNWHSLGESTTPIRCVSTKALR